MADNLTQVLSNYIIYVDSSSLMHGNMEFFKISLYNVLKSTKSKIKVVDFVVKDLRRKQFSDSEKFAVKALKILDFYRKAGLVEDVVTSGIENGKILDVIYNNRNVDKDDVCVITENKELASEIVTNLSARRGIDFNYKIAAVRLINGPALWNIQTVKERVMPIKREAEPVRESVSFSSIKPPSFDSPKESFVEERVEKTVEQEPLRVEPVKVEPQKEYREETIKTVEEVIKPVEEIKPEVVTPKEESFRPVRNSRIKRGKLVVSMIVDNSSSLNAERSELLKNALDSFYKDISSSDVASDLDLAVYGFDGFSPRVIKGYDGDLDIQRFNNGGIQVLGKTIEAAMDDLISRQKLYESHNIETHKPWLIILTDGGAYKDVTPQAKRLKSIVRNKKITYFPFSLSTMELDPSIESLSKLKMFLKVRDNKFTELFNFLSKTLKERINTPDGVSMKLDRETLKGFIAR